MLNAHCSIVIGKYTDQYRQPRDHSSSKNLSSSFPYVTLTANEILRRTTSCNVTDTGWYIMDTKVLFWTLNY